MWYKFNCGKKNQKKSLSQTTLSEITNINEEGIGKQFTNNLQSSLR